MRLAWIYSLGATLAILFIHFSGSFLTESSSASSLPAISQAIEDVPDILTSDIQEEIEKHIADQALVGNGYFRVPFEDRELFLNLVRVHVEYLATLTPTLHFACVDMVDKAGEFYDIDFFMKGIRGNMKVTETTVHKINGRPLYIWKQASDKTWGRVSVDGATNELLGVIEGRDRFTFIYKASIPKIEKSARMWLPLAGSDDFQKVEVSSISAPAQYKTIVDPAHGNKAVFLALTPEQSGKNVTVVYEVERLEKGAYEGGAEDAERYLAPEKRVQVDEKIKETSGEIVAGKEGQLMRARAIYDHVIDNMAYKKCGSGWGAGDAQNACHTLSGNCTDFHSYFIALCRAAGIPARFAIGASIPSDRDEGGVDGYHCWAEFYAEGKWWPVDISEADKFTALSMYYFGHHPANRFEFSRGRDLILDPMPLSGPINFLAYPVLEVDGRDQKAKIVFGFRRERMQISPTTE